MDSLLYEKKYGLIFWYFFPVAFLILVYDPFQLPIQFDRAYLLYLSQVVFRGDSLYADTTFGYTPLSVLLVGQFMKISGVFSLDTIEAARVFGILFYGLICASVYSFLKRCFDKGYLVIVGMILFLGFDYIMILSGVNAEPKIWVLLFTVLGINSFSKERYLLAGLWFALAAMSWHVAVISLFACTSALIFRRKDFVLNFKWLVIGVLLGTIPVALYLSITDQWLDFWNQAVLRKVKYEGKVLGEAPLEWLQLGIYPGFITELLHFLLAVIGFLMLLYRSIIDKLSKVIVNKSFTVFLLCFIFWWGLFNSFEFQSNVDLFPLIPIVLLFATYCFGECLRFSRKTKAILLLIVTGYCFFNAFGFRSSIEFNEQKSLFQQLDERFGQALAVGTLEYYVVKEQATPTKYLNFHKYENVIIKDNIQCDKLNALVAANEITYIIDYDIINRVAGKSPIPKFLGNAVNITKDRTPKKKNKSKHVPCLADLLERYKKERDHPDSLVLVPSQKALIKDSYFDLEGYHIYELRD